MKKYPDKTYAKNYVEGQLLGSVRNIIEKLYQERLPMAVDSSTALFLDCGTKIKCPACGEVIFFNNYCGHCGQPLVWEGGDDEPEY